MERTIFFEAILIFSRIKSLKEGCHDQKKEASELASEVSNGKRSLWLNIDGVFCGDTDFDGTTIAW